ncbi:MAG: hypothetical protein ABSA70_05310 [Terriglobia bacterium]
MRIIQSLWFAAALGLFLAAPATWAQKPATDVAAQDLHSPGKGSAERKAILDALRAKMNTGRIFVVETLRVHNGWAWTHVKPQSRDGKRHYEDIWALLQEHDGSWQTVELQCTEVGNPTCTGGGGAYERLRAKFPAAPEDIFQETPTREAAEKPLGVEVVRASYGSGPDDLGHSIPEEAAPEGPMSFALGSKGEIYVLDQLNARIQVFRDKKRIETIPIPDNSNSDFKDIDVTKDGKIVLLDASMQKKVYLLDAEGTVLNKLPLKGRNVPSADSVYGMYCREDGMWDGIWVETEGRSVRIADLAGNPDPRRIAVMGWFTYKGTRLLRAEVLGDVTAGVHISEENKTRWKDFRLVFDMPVGGLELVNTDQADDIFVEASLGEDSKAANIALVLNLEGQEKKRINLFVSHRVEQTFRNFRLSPDGKIYQMALDDEGVAVRRYDP